MCADSVESEKLDEKVNKDEDKHRIFNILAYFFIVVIIGIQIWWYTTRVYRANVPMDEIFEEQIAELNKTFGIPLSLEYDVLITLVNPDPEELDVDLQGEELTTHFERLLKQISSVNTFVFKSQWLFYTELGITYVKVNNGYILEERQLPHIITPLETKLWSHLSPRPAINFVVYFAQCGRPVYIYNNNGEKSPTNAFISPRWGGVMIINPNKEACEKKRFIPNKSDVIYTFMMQIVHLFNMKSFKNKHIEEFKVQQIINMVNTTHRTLRSLAQLLLEISRIVISDEVAEKINIAVENVKLAETYLREGKVEESLMHAKVAFSNSEAAFSDPSLLALLYFPEDQKYAVYIPLFLPIMIPVFMSLATVKKWYKNGKVKVE